MTQVKSGLVAQSVEQRRSLSELVGSIPTHQLRDFSLSLGEICF